MKRLFILCDLYPPAFAPRVAYLTQYLRQFGWSPIVFTEEVDSHQLFDDFTIPCLVYRVRLQAKSRVERALSFALEALGEYKDRQFCQAIGSYIEKHQIPKPNAILCMTYRKFPLYTARHLAHLWQIPWVADCRDLIEQYSHNDFLPQPIKVGKIRLAWLEQLLAERFIHLRNKNLISASAVTTVAQWHKAVLSRYHNETSIVYNGYDHKLFAPSYPTTATFRIVFTGRLLSLAMRDPSILLEALSTPELSQLPLSLDFYTDDLSAKLLRSLPLFRDNAKCQTHPMVSSREVPRLLSEASIILLLGNKEGDAWGPNGMVSTKLFEALAMQKPTLLLPDTSGEAAQILKRSRCGIATDSHREIIDFILQHYQHWQKIGFTVAHQADRAYIQHFSRRRGAQAFAEILDKITQ